MESPFERGIKPMGSISHGVIIIIIINIIIIIIILVHTSVLASRLIKELITVTINLNILLNVMAITTFNPLYKISKWIESRTHKKVAG